MGLVPRSLRPSVAAAAILLGFASTALAQTPGRLPGDEPMWLRWVVALGLMVVIFLPGFLNPKRTHLS